VESGWETLTPLRSTLAHTKLVPRPAHHSASGASWSQKCQYWLIEAVLTFSVVDPIDEAWARVEADWANPEAHRRFVGVCVALERLPEAGKRYRDVRETDPARRDDAIAQIDTLIGLATQQLQDTRVAAPTDQHKRTLTWAAFFIMLVLMGAGVWLLMRG
jgi:hypothetical protein